MFPTRRREQESALERSGHCVLLRVQTATESDHSLLKENVCSRLSAPEQGEQQESPEAHADVGLRIKAKQRKSPLREEWDLLNTIPSTELKMLKQKGRPWREAPTKGSMEYMDG